MIENGSPTPGPEPPPDNALPTPADIVVATRRVPPWDYTDLLAVVGCGIAVGLAVMLIAGIITLATNVKLGTTIALPLEFVIYAIWFWLVAMYLRMKYRLHFWSGLGWKWHRAYLAPALTGGVLLAIGVAITGVLLRTPQTDDTLIQELMRSPLTRTMVVIAATTVGPVCEELFFRGFLLPLFVRSFGSAAAIALSALPFALMHGPQYKWRWQLVLLIFIAGCAFGWVRLRTGSTATSAVMHAGYNSVFFITYFAQKGLTS